MQTAYYKCADLQENFYNIILNENKCRISIFVCTVLSRGRSIYYLHALRYIGIAYFV